MKSNNAMKLTTIFSMRFSLQKRAEARLECVRRRERDNNSDKDQVAHKC